MFSIEFIFPSKKVKSCKSLLHLLKATTATNRILNFFLFRFHTPSSGGITLEKGNGFNFSPFLPDRSNCGGGRKRIYICQKQYFLLLSNKFFERRLTHRNQKCKVFEKVNKNWRFPKSEYPQEYIYFCDKRWWESVLIKVVIAAAECEREYFVAHPPPPSPLHSLQWIFFSRNTEIRWRNPLQLEALAFSPSFSFFVQSEWRLRKIERWRKRTLGIVLGQRQSMCGNKPSQQAASRWVLLLVALWSSQKWLSFLSTFLINSRLE